MTNCFGVFQTYYARELLQHVSPSSISWIGSTQSFLLLFVGVISGPLFDAGHLHLLLGTGAVLIGVGLMATSVCTEYWQVVLAQGLCMGVGTGCLYVPSLAIVPQWFGRRHKALAVGLVTCGSSFGGVIYSLMFQGLQPRLGFPWATRVMGFMAIATLAVALSVLRRRKDGDDDAAAAAARKSRPLLELAAFRERPYVIYCAAMWPSFLGFITPVFYLQPFALEHGLAGSSVALYLVAILNASSVPGRIAPSFVAERIGPVQTMFLCIFLTGTAVFGWTACGSGGPGAGQGSIAFAVLFGFFSGGIVALPPVVLSSFTRDPSRLGTRLGMSSMFNALGSLFGAPIAGAILKSRAGGWLGLQLYSGFLFMATALGFLILRFVLTGGKILAKA